MKIRFLLGLSIMILVLILISMLGCSENTRDIRDTEKKENVISFDGIEPKATEDNLSLDEMVDFQIVEEELTVYEEATDTVIMWDGKDKKKEDER